MRPRNFFMLIMLLISLVASAASSPIPATAQPLDPLLPPGICFPETSKCVRGLLYNYWVENGGLAQQGFAITDEFNEVNSLDGKTYRVQYFERARFEFHPEKVNTPFVVLLGLLGRDQFQARYPADRPKPGGPAGNLGDPGVCFPEATGFCIKGAFLNYWQQRGGLAQHGYPLTEEFTEVNSADSKPYTVQYFERGRFEYHAENAGTPFEVLLGLVGREIYQRKHPGGQPPAIDPKTPAINIYKDAMTTELSQAVKDIPARVYVPNENGGNMVVIDPKTFAVIDSFGVGSIPHHATPSWDMTKLHVNNMGSSNLTELDARTGKPVNSIPIPVPYNMYYTLDGTKAIVAAEPANRMDFYDPKTWTLLKSVYIPWPGIDHMDMSADGKYVFAGTEFSGVVVKVNTVTMELVSFVNVGGLPIDVRLSPDGSVFYVANQGRNGVSIVDPVAMKEIGFIQTGAGAHGMHVSRDAKLLYVSNRYAGTISVIAFESRSVIATWNIGGSPDMLQISPDGTQLWASGRFNGGVYVIDTRTGALIRTIFTGAAPHGLAYFPQPGKFSIGHNGVYR